MMDGIILAPLALLSVPVLLIVILVKVCGLENKVTDLALKLTVIDFTQRHRDTESVASRRGAEAQRGLTNLCASVPLCEKSSVSADLTQSHRDTENIVSRKDADAQRSLELGAKPPAPQNDLCASVPLCETPKKPYEPTALDLFWMRVEDWLAVRGDFAPKGMTREFAFATRWLVRIGVALIVGALIYFVKLSIDRGWMRPTGRVAATLFWGMVGCVGGS